WYFAFSRPAARQAVASSEVIADFNVGLAALEVEDNERALQALEAAVKHQQEEPALWADLAIAQLRLNKLSDARQSLDRALQLAPESRELALLNAELLSHSGQVEEAIEQLQELHQRWPENIAATYSLVTLLGQIRSSDADAQRLQLLTEILTYRPDNLLALTEKARVAAALQDEPALQLVLEVLESDRYQWPEPLQQQLDKAKQAASKQDFRQAALAMTFFQNLLKPRAEFQQSLLDLGNQSAASVGTPVREFLRLAAPPVEAADADLGIAFEPEKAAAAGQRPDRVWVMERPGQASAVIVTLSGDQLQIGDSPSSSFPGKAESVTRASLYATDLNFDFRPDLVAVGDQGAIAYLGKEDGALERLPISFSDQEEQAAWRGVWSFDVDADGDMDLLLSDRETQLRWIRNNGDMTFEEMPEFIDARQVVDVKFADFDNDGDVDLATLDTAGKLVLWRNDRNGIYISMPLADRPRAAMAVGDVNRDGQFDLLSITASSELLSASLDSESQWNETALASLSLSSDSASLKPDADVFLAVADIDNNGASDVLVSAAAKVEMWLREPSGDLARVTPQINMTATAVADLDGDGLLDLVGMLDAGGRLATNASKAGYGWQVIEPMANPNAGDKRINSFGIGGRVDMRAGNVVQAAVIASPRVHFGLGKQRAADLVRIVWPNGTSQAEFDFGQSSAFVANQRLKGSCPWIFTYDGKGYRFVKDFIWRSPLGLRINAQTTAGVTQTKDWVKIAGNEMAPRDGRYSVRITAELWETHFFDHVSLLSVDHPADVSVLVDERFVPTQMPEHRVIAATHPQPLQDLHDDQGNRLDDRLRANDGVYADQFELGAYQGVASEHSVQFTLPPEVSLERQVLIVGRGWIYPTDSSLNVAIAQGDAERPFGLMLERKDTDGHWQVVHDNLGFPAGKNKEIVIEIPHDAHMASHEFRLRTNMEIYWDSLRWCYALPDAKPRVAELKTETADLRYRGFSRLQPLDRRKPDTPIYEVAATDQQWLDLEGYYTRFGDVRELLAAIDDRYVIMNAGDELHFDFEMTDSPPEGWQRDFILVGDGWVKDGDFNTTFSQTVEPLPDHADAEYGPMAPLAHDPIYRRHADDWIKYHTRYVTPRHFTGKLWKSAERLTSGEASQ
ncbi:MAG: FG-GAP-like repeat-containing protein, partial [Aureliella sp.]